VTLLVAPLHSRLAAADQLIGFTQAASCWIKKSRVLTLLQKKFCVVWIDFHPFPNQIQRDEF
jgi:hypothetical protein